MAGRIPKNFIDDLLARTDIVEVVDAHVKLTKAGQNHKACCPFHHEKSPSFTVSADKQFYHCFGCGAHGTAVGFLMEYLGLDFPEAIETLAERLGLEVPREGGGPSEDWAPLREGLNAANQWFRNQLKNHGSRQLAVEYLKGRGLSGKIAVTFELGFAPAGRDNLLKALKSPSVDTQHLVKAGLVAERGPGQYVDRFRNRIMFPIHDRRGQVIGFGARVLDDGQPKYLNSPETPLFHKGRELYGLYQARKANRKLDRLVVVEGYMDVVALAQYGVTNAVATLGTAATSEHVERLFQQTSRVVFCFDGDRAGRQAAWRALENALPHMRDGRGIAFVFLPDGEDPDSLVRAQGSEAFEALVNNAKPLSDVLFDQLSADLDLRSMEGRSKLFQDAKPLIDKLPASAFQELARSRLAELTELSTSQLSQLSGETSRTAGTRRRKSNDVANEKRAPSLVRTAIRLLLHHPRLAQEVDNPQQLEGVRLAGISLLREMIELLHESPDLTVSAVLEHFRDHTDGQHLGKLLVDGAPLPEGDSGAHAEFTDAVSRMSASVRQNRRRVLERKASEPEGLTSAEKAEYAALVTGQTRN